MVEVIGVGFGRTGTASLTIALTELGFGPCYHMTQVLERPDRAARWIRAWQDPTGTDWSRLLAGYRATTDWPGAAVWRQLVDHFPAAKVILTVRDPDRWYDSVASTIFRAAIRRARRPPRLTHRLSHRLLRGVAPWVRGYEDLERKVLLDGVFGGRFTDREHAIEVYQQHLKDVREHVAADRLLVYEVGDGWPRLCEFLGVPVPETTFPNINHGTEFRGFERGWTLRAVLRRPRIPIGSHAPEGE